MFVFFAQCCAFEPVTEAAIQQLHVLSGAAAWSSSGSLLELFVGIHGCPWVFICTETTPKVFHKACLCFLHGVVPLNLALKQQFSVCMSWWELQPGTAVAPRWSSLWVFVDVHGCLFAQKQHQKTSTRSHCVFSMLPCLQTWC